MTGLLLATYISISAWSLSSEQVAQRDFGRFDASFAISESLGPGDHVAYRRLQQAEASVPSTALVLGGRVLQGEKQLDYIELALPSNRYPGLTITSGRWPSGPGEIVVSGDLARRVDAGETLEFLSGRVRLHVVGEVTDRFSNSTLVFAAPGTFEEFPQNVVLAQTELSMAPWIYVPVSGLPAIRATLQRVGLSGTMASRASSEPEKSWVLEAPFAAVVPVILGPFLACAAGIGVSARRVRAFCLRAASVGMRQRVASIAVIIAMLVATGIGIVIGALVGELGGQAGRLLVSRVAGREAGPSPRLLVPVVLISLGSVAGILVGFVAIRRSPRVHQVGRPASTRAASGRRWLALVVACLSMFSYVRVADVTSAMVFGALVSVVWLLLLPDVVALVSAQLDRSEPSLRLAARILPHYGAAAGIALLTILIGLPLTTVLTLTATGTTQRLGAMAEVGPRQLMVSHAGGFMPAPPKVVAIAKQELPDVEFVPVSVVENASYKVERGNAAVMAVDTVDEVERVWGKKLDGAQLDILQRGGYLVWQSGYRLMVGQDAVADGVPFGTYLPSAEWQGASGAVMLRSSAASLGMVLQRTGPLIGIGVSSQQASELAAEVARAGYDPSTIKAYHPPDPILPRKPLVASAVLLVILLLSAAFLAQRGQVASMRRQLQRLVAIGARPRFACRTLVIAQVVTIVISLVGATMMAAATCLSVLIQNDGIELEPPYGIVLLIGVAFAIAMALTTVLGTRRLDAQAAREA